MTQQTFWNPFTTNTNAWWQALSSPWQAQSAYWQTVQTLMQQRIRAMQGMAEMTQLAYQGFQQSQSPSDVAAIMTAWWGTQTKSLAQLNADTQSAQQHLWEQWQKTFPLLDKTIWTQQYSAWQQACKSVMMQTQPTTGTSTSNTQTSSSSSSYTQPRGTFIRGGQQTTSTATTTPKYLGPTAPGSAPRSVAKAAETALPLVNTQVVKEAVKAVKAPARTAMADTVISPVTKVTTYQLQVSAELQIENLTGENDASNVTSISSSRTRMTGTAHANLSAAASTRRSVAARRVSKGRR